MSARIFTENLFKESKRDEYLIEDYVRNDKDEYIIKLYKFRKRERMISMGLVVTYIILFILAFIMV